MVIEQPALLQARFGEIQYPVYVGAHLLAEADLFVPYVAKRPVFIIIQRAIVDLYGSLLSETLKSAGARSVFQWTVADGEQAKTLQQAQRIWSQLFAQDCTRETVIVALGGGAVSDLAGFCAAAYLRGISVLLCPTTLLAQADAAVGGKTGINSVIKNAIGFLYPPIAVIADVSTLHTLPSRLFVSGIAELIKYGAALDRPFFDWLWENMAPLLQRDHATLQEAVYRGCQQKAEVVARDCHDRHQRLLLNFGHTLGHAVEGVSYYRRILHGEAVAIGMVAAAYLSFQKGHIAWEVVERIRALLVSATLPTQLPSTFSIEALLAKIHLDKKRLGSEPRWILLDALGSAFVCEKIDPALLIETMIWCKTH